MHLADIIQMLIFTSMAVTVLFMAVQTRLQNRVLSAQLLRDRLDLYWKTYEPVTDDQLRQFADHPEDYFMSRPRYDELYKDHPTAARRHIQMSMLYEYMAFTYKLKGLSIRDPLGKQWLELWTTHLLEDQEFLSVHQCFRGFYPEYEAFVDHMAAKGNPALAGKDPARVARK